MSRRDIYSTYFELLAARMFRRWKFDIDAWPETGIKGRDFDFHAFNDTDKINVEVTSLRASRFDPKKLVGKLKRKSKQMPAFMPGIIMCSYPPAWFSRPEDSSAALAQVAMKFFQASRRVNAVIFLSDLKIELADGRGLLGHYHSIAVNHAPRFAVSLDRILVDHPLGPPWRAYLQTGDLDVDACLQHVNTNQVSRWISVLSEELRHAKKE